MRLTDGRELGADSRSGNRRRWDRPDFSFASLAMVDVCLLIIPAESLTLLPLLSVKRLDKNISNNIFLVDLFYYWYLSGQSYNYLLCA